MNLLKFYPNFMKELNHYFFYLLSSKKWKKKTKNKLKYMEKENFN